VSIQYLCHKHGAQPRRPCPVCKREKNRKRIRSPLQRATGGVGKRGAEYVKRRKEYLDIGLLCEWNDCGAPATEIHHKVRTGPDDPLWLDKANWMPCCNRCHSELEAALMTRDEKGRWTGKR
jgi:5-methylcytosine-specific restriction endonuclease McrA